MTKARVRNASVKTPQGRPLGFGASGGGVVMSLRGRREATTLGQRAGAAGAAEADVLQSGPERIPNRRRQLVAAGVAVLLLVAGGVTWRLDSQARAAEFTALMTCVSRAEDTWAVAEARVMGMVSYVRPSLSYARPSIGAGTTEDMTRSLYRLIAAQATIGVPEVRRAVRSCSNVSVRGFHQDLRSAHEAYLRCLGTELGRLRSTAVDGSHAFTGSERLTRLRHRARERLVAAAPDAAGRWLALTVMYPDRPRLRAP